MRALKLSGVLICVLVNMSCKGTVANVATELSGVQSTGAKMGQKGKLRVTFTSPVSSDTDVTVTSLSPTIANVPQHVTVPTGALTADVEYDGIAIGQAIVTATSGAQTRSTTLSVVDDFRVYSSNSTTALEVGALVGYGFSLNASPPAPTDIAITVADASIVTVPSTITVTPFTSYQQLYLSGKGVGSTLVTASLGGATANLNVKVVDHARLRYFSVPNVLENGSYANLSVSLDATVAQTTPVTITSSDPSVAAAPTTMIVPAGSTSSPSVAIQVVGVGTTQFTATLGDSTLGGPLTSIASAQISSLSFNTALQAGFSSLLNVSLNATAAMPHVITLTSSDPSVLAVPATATIDANNSSVSLAVTPLKNGDAVIIASFNGLSVQVAAHVGGNANTNPLYLYAPTPVAVGGFTNLQVYTYTYGKSVMLTSSDPTVIAVPDTVQVSYGQTIALNPLKAGTTTITATSNGMSAFYDIRVVDHVTISQMPSSITLNVGQSTTSYIYLSAVAPIGTVLTLTSSDPAVLSVPATVTPSDGQTYAPVPIKGLATGTALLTATVGATSRTAVVYVGGTTNNVAYLSSASADSTTLQVGASTAATVSLSTSTLNDLPIDVTFGTPGIVSIPTALPLIAAGQSQVTYPLRAIGAGSTVVNVTVDGKKVTFTVNVVTDPTFTLTGPSNLAVGGFDVVTLQSNCALPANVTFAIASSTPAAATVSASTATLGPGSGAPYVNLGVKGVATGSSNITATSGAIVKTLAVSVP